MVCSCSLLDGLALSRKKNLAVTRKAVHAIPKSDEKSNSSGNFGSQAGASRPMRLKSGLMLGGIIDGMHRTLARRNELHR
jgi:hypothetical protein